MTKRSSDHSQAEIDNRANQLNPEHDAFWQWGEALNLLDQLLSVAEEFGMIHSQRLRAGKGRFPRSYPLLIDLHSRGVQVAEETPALLRCGFAAGAEARWLTLHETSVVAAFIAKHGVSTAERFIEHDHVRVKKEMDVEQQHHVRRLPCREPGGPCESGCAAGQSG